MSGFSPLEDKKIPPELPGGIFLRADDYFNEEYQRREELLESYVID